MKWFRTGPTITDAEIEEFERATGERIPEGYRWFLKHVANGGRPEPLVIFPIIEGPGGETEAEMAGLYGINPSGKGWDLSTNLDHLSEFGTHRGLPIGGTLGGDVFLLIREGPRSGQVRYMNHGDYVTGETQSYLIAPSMEKFIRVLEREWNKGNTWG